jgi:hypothetical protein
MSDVQFHDTRDGRQFYRDFHDVATVGLPELTRQVSRLADLVGLLVEAIDRRSQPTDAATGNPEDHKS